MIADWLELTAEQRVRLERDKQRHYTLPPDTPIKILKGLECPFCYIKIRYRELKRKRYKTTLMKEHIKYCQENPKNGTSKNKL